MKKVLSLEASNAAVTPAPLPGSPNRQMRESAAFHRRPSAFPRLTPCDVARSSVLALGFTRVNGTRSPRRKPGDSGWHAFPGAMRSGFEPENCVPSSGMDGGVVFVTGVPGFPPGASWTGDKTDSQIKGSAHQRSQPHSCSGDALSSHSAHNQNPRLRAPRRSRAAHGQGLFQSPQAARYRARPGLVSAFCSIHPRACSIRACSRLTSMSPATTRDRRNTKYVSSTSPRQ